MEFATQELAPKAKEFAGSTKRLLVLSFLPSPLDKLRTTPDLRYAQVVSSQSISEGCSQNGRGEILPHLGGCVAVSLPDVRRTEGGGELTNNLCALPPPSPTASESFSCKLA